MLKIEYVIRTKETKLGPNASAFSSRADAMNKEDNDALCSLLIQKNVCHEEGCVECIDTDDAWSINGGKGVLSPRNQALLEKLGVQFYQRKSVLREDGAYPMTMEELRAMAEKECALTFVYGERMEAYLDAAYVLGVLKERGAMHPSEVEAVK